jgi:hypothetical protein
VRVRLAVRRLIPVLVTGLAMGLSACGGSEQPAQPSAAKSPAPAPGASASAAPGTGGAPAARAQPAAASLPEAAPGDLANFSCTRRRGVWSAQGDVSNSAQEPMVYAVTVATVADTGVTGQDTDRLVLEPDESTRFELRAIAQGAVDSCLPRVVRTPR